METGNGKGISSSKQQGMLCEAVLESVNLAPMFRVRSRISTPLQRGNDDSTHFLHGNLQPVHAQPGKRSVDGHRIEGAICKANGR